MGPTLNIGKLDSMVPGQMRQTVEELIGKLNVTSEGPERLVDENERPFDSFRITNTTTASAALDVC
jgi:hypothetical protein